MNRGWYARLLWAIAFAMMAKIFQHEDWGWGYLFWIPYVLCLWMIILVTWQLLDFIKRDDWP